MVLLAELRFREAAVFVAYPGEEVPDRAQLALERIGDLYAGGPFCSHALQRELHRLVVHGADVRVVWRWSNLRAWTARGWWALLNLWAHMLVNAAGEGCDCWRCGCPA